MINIKEYVNHKKSDNNLFNLKGSLIKYHTKKSHHCILRKNPHLHKFFKLIDFM